MELVRTCWQDVRYAARILAQAPGFTAVAALTLALGIGANTAIFSIIDAVLLRPLPYRNPDQLVRLNETEAAPGRYPFAGPDYIDWKKQNQTFQDMTLFGWTGQTILNGEGSPDVVRTLPVEWNFFSLFGVAPLKGRTFVLGEDQPGNDRVAVLSYAFWNSRYAGDPGAIGRNIQLAAKQYTIIGVMPPEFRFPTQAQIWIPLQMDAKGLGIRGNHWCNAVGRMKPGVSVKTAEADLKVIAARLEKQYPDSNDKVGATAQSLRDSLVGNSRSSLWLMLSAVGLVLLIACANVANLLLARAVKRQKELAVRSALGAGRWRLLRQLLSESLLLGATGGALGLGLAWAIVKAVSTSKIFSLPLYRPIELNPEVLGFTFALAVVTGLLFGGLPAVGASRPDLHEELKGGAGSAITPGRQRRLTSNVLVVGELALSLTLLVGAGLLLKDFVRLRSLDIGVRSDGVLTAAVALPEARYKTRGQRHDFAERLLDKAAHIPGVETAGLSSVLPLEGGSNYYVKLRGQTTARSNELVESHRVSPEYFRARGIPLMEGRVFTAAEAEAYLALGRRYDQAQESGVRMPPEELDTIITPVVINQAMARTFWKGESALGKLFSQGSDHGPWRQVVGVVGDVRQWGLLQRPVPEAYDPLVAEWRVFAVVRSALPESGVTRQIRAAVNEIDSTLPVFSVRTMNQVIAENAQGQQFMSTLVGSFAGLAMLLAAVGIYGVLAYAVTQRTREIGIRMSLGASRGRLLRQVMWSGLRLGAMGFAAGLAGAFAAGKLLASQLHEVNPHDPAVFVATTGVLAAVAALACYVPARRAARLDPMRALRYE